MTRYAVLLTVLAGCSGGDDSSDGSTTLAGTTTTVVTPTSGDDTGEVETSVSTGTVPETSSTTDETSTTTTTGETPTDPPPGCGGLPLCDDFEGAAAGGPPDVALWTVGSPNCSGSGTLAIDDVVAHSGSRSLRIDGGGGYCDHVFAAHTMAIEEIGTVVYGRVWVRFESKLGQGHTTFLTLRDAADSGGKDLRMGGQSEIFMWNRESDDATLPALSPAGIALSTAPVAGAWTCVEFMVDEAQGLLTTWVDGDEVAGLVVDAAPTPDVDQQWYNKPMWRPSLADFKIGWESYAGQTMTLYFDDVALNGERIGCL